jgi:glycosyltransferase involved in cell wall biosynthesis
MKNPLISIILPTYNRATLLPRAIDSVLAQSFQDWELIIWDDGSTDNTSAVVQAYQDARIRYDSDENRGAAYARNRALEHARAELIAFLDSDDEWLPGKLEIQAAVMARHPEVELLFTDFENITESNGQWRGNFSEYTSVIRLQRCIQIEADCYRIQGCFLVSLARENFIALDTVIVRQEVLQRAGCFNETLRNSEDFELWWRLGLSGATIARLDQISMIRHKPEGSLSSPSMASLQNRLSALDMCAGHAIDQQKPDLIAGLTPQYRNAWQLLMAVYTKRGEWQNARHALAKSLSYGFRPGTLRLLVQSLAAYTFRRGRQDAR